MRQRAGIGECIQVLDRQAWITLRTASSVTLPDRVRGMSGTAMIFAGTCLGVV